MTSECSSRDQDKNLLVSVLLDMNNRSEMGVMDSMPGWFKRWLHPDMRRSLRRLSPNLVAHCWTGGAPKAIEIRDISPTGLFLLTDERWFVGTVIKVTVQRLDCDPEDVLERSITVSSMVVRCSSTGVALDFIFDAPKDALRGDVRAEKLADKRALSRFLELATSEDREIIGET